MELDPMIGHLIVYGIVGIVSGGLGAIVTNAVQNQRLKALEKRADKIDIHLERHDSAFSERVLFKDDLKEKCKACSKLDGSQHENLVASIKVLSDGQETFRKDIQKFQTETVEAFRSCTDDLVKALREEVSQ